MKKDKDLSVQGKIPLRDMQAWLAILEDGTMRAFLRFSGKNQSLVTAAQSMREAFLFAAVLGSIKVPFEILKYPMPVSSASYLVQIDRAIARERTKMYEAKTEGDAEASRLKLAILESHMRSDAKKESSSGDRFQCPTYMVLKFPSKMTQQEATREIDNLVRIAAEKLGKAPEKVGAAEFTQLCGMYFTPQSSGAEACIYTPDVVMPLIP